MLLEQGESRAFRKSEPSESELARKPLSRYARKKDAGGVAACIIIRVLASIIEFQRQLYIPHRLGAGDLSHTGIARRKLRCAQAHVRSVVINVVKEVDEVIGKSLCKLRSTSV